MPPNTSTSIKRPRTQDDVDAGKMRKLVSESFKSKLLSNSSPSSWSRFGAGKDKLTIGDGDISTVEGQNGPAMKLSSDLKLRLYKPWSNALILKLMGRPHTLNFMISKLNQKWPLIGQ